MGELWDRFGTISLADDKRCVTRTRLATLVSACRDLDRDMSGPRKTLTQPLSHFSHSHIFGAISRAVFTPDT